MFYGEKKKCAGSYSVKGYTREDGTKVQGYTRTCGAKHAGSGSITGAAANVGDNENKKFDLNVVKNEIQNDKKVFDSLLGNIIYPGTLANLQEKMEFSKNYSEPYHKYYKLSLDFANQKQINKDNIYIKFKDIDNNLMKSFIKKKFDIPSLSAFTNVVIPQQNCSIVKTVLNSPEFKNELRLRMDDIKKGKFINDSFTITFNITKDAHLTLGHATLYNMRVVNNHICGTLIDYYDFDKLYYKIKNLKEYSHSYLPVAANANALLQQNTGRLTNYLIIFPVRYPVNKI